MTQRVRTDTPYYAIRSVWYGPGGNLKPARYTAWMTGTVLALVLIGVLTLIVPFDVLIINFLVALVLGPIAALAITSRIFAHIDFYRPLTAWWQIFKTELTAPRPQPETARVRIHEPMKVRRHT